MATLAFNGFQNRINNTTNFNGNLKNIKPSFQFQAFKPYIRLNKCCSLNDTFFELFFNTVHATEAKIPPT